MVNPVGMGVERHGESSIVDIPDLYGLVVGGCVDLSEATPFHAGNRSLVPGEDHINSSLICIPNTHCAILRRRGDTWVSLFLDVVWLPRKGSNPFRVTLQWLAALLSSSRIPNPDCVVHASGRKLGFVG